MLLGERVLSLLLIADFQGATGFQVHGQETESAILIFGAMVPCISHAWLVLGRADRKSVV